MTIRKASERLEAMLNRHDPQYRHAWATLDDLLRELLIATINNSRSDITRLSGKISSFVRLRLATARGVLTELIMDDLSITPTQTLANQIMRIAFEKGLSTNAANANFALPGRTAATKLAPEGIRKIEDNLPLVSQYSALYATHEEKLRAKVAAICKEAKSERNAERKGRRVMLARGQAELFS